MSEIRDAIERDKEKMKEKRYNYKCKHCGEKFVHKRNFKEHKQKRKDL